MKTVAVAEVAEQVTGVTYKKGDARSTAGDGLTGVLRAGNIDGNGLLQYDDLVFVPDSCVKPKQLLRKNDVLIATSSGSLEVVGKAGIALEDRPQAFGAFCKVLRPGPAIDPRYFAQCFRRPEYRHYVERVAAGININNLKKSDLDEIEIPLPPIEEQRRIAAVLDAADDLRTKRRQALAKLDTLTQAIFIDMFGDQRPSAFFGDLVDGFRLGTSNKSATHGSPTLRIPNVVGGSVSYEDMKTVPVDSAELDRLKLQDGDLLFVRSNGNPDNVGRCAGFSSRDAEQNGFTEPVLFASYLIRARLGPELLPTFAVAFLNSERGRQQLRANCATSAGQYNINTKGLGKVRIPTPNVQDQMRFDARVSTVVEYIQGHQTCLTELETLFASLQQRAFAGEL